MSIMAKFTEGLEEIRPHITKSECTQVRMLRTVKPETKRIPDNTGRLRVIAARSTTSKMKWGALRGAKMASLLIRIPKIMTNCLALPASLP